MYIYHKLIQASVLRKLKFYVCESEPLSGENYLYLTNPVILR